MDLPERQLHENGVQAQVLQTSAQAKVMQALTQMQLLLEYILL